MRFLITGIFCLLVSLGVCQQNPLPMAMLSSRVTLALRQDVSLALGLSPQQVIKLQEEMNKTTGIQVNGNSTGVLGVFEQVDVAAKPVFSEDQWKRLGELWIQFDGPFVLQSLEIREKLALSEETVAKISEACAAYAGFWNRHITQVRKSRDLDKIKGEAKKTCKKLLGFLTAEQRKKFTELEGPKFKFKN